MSLASLFIRITWAQNDRKRDRGLVPPENLAIHKDIPYGPDKMQRLDVYRPANYPEPLPVIVSVHGGGWVYGDKELYRHYCMDLAARGFAVVNFTYRLSPEHKFPCHLEDTALAFRWALEHSSEYGMDPANVFAVGDSAGGHILALFCCLCANPTFAAAFDFSVPRNFAPKAVALNCGVYDLATAGAGSTHILIRDVLGHKASNEELRSLSPVQHVASGFPPCYIMTANEDFLRDQPASLIPVLEEKQIPYEYHCYGDDQVKLGHVFHLDMRKEHGRRCNDEECDFFRQYLS